MALSDILSAKLAKVQARIAEIETEYPKMIRLKSYSRGFGVASTTYQDFGPMSSEYMSLLDAEEELQLRIDELTDAASGGTYLVSTRGVTA